MTMNSIIFEYSWTIYLAKRILSQILYGKRKQEPEQKSQMYSMNTNMFSLMQKTYRLYLIGE